MEMNENTGKKTDETLKDIYNADTTEDLFGRVVDKVIQKTQNSKILY